MLIGFLDLNSISNKLHFQPVGKRVSLHLYLQHGLSEKRSFDRLADLTLFGNIRP
jgi:hypothetical protein